MDFSKKVGLIFIILTILSIIGTIIYFIVKSVEKFETDIPILSISCSNCINKCDEQFQKTDIQWAQCALNAISDKECRCPDLNTLMKVKL